MYGSAEATARMSYVPWKYATKKIGSVGLPISGGKFWLEKKTTGRIVEKANIYAASEISVNKHMDLEYTNE